MACRVLLSNALRRKRFHKEAIRVEVLSSNVASHSKEARHQELLKWDPLSSGEGDILLDDMENSGSTSCKASKTIKAIDFDSVLDSLPSQGCQLKDFLPANDAFSIFSNNKVNFVSVAKNVNQSTSVPNTLTEQSNRPDICPEQDGRSSLEGILKPHIVRCDNFFEKVINSETTEAFHSNEIETEANDAKLELKNSIDSDVRMDDMEKPFTACKASEIAKATVDSYNNGNLLPVAESVNQSIPVPNNSTEQPDRLNLSPKQKERLSDTVTTDQNVSCDNVFEKNVHSGTIESFNSNVEIDTQTKGTELGIQNFIESDVDCIPFEAKTLDSHPGLCNSSNALDTIKAHGNEKLLKSLDEPHNIDEKVEISTPSKGISFPAPVHKKHKEKNNDVTLNAHLSTVHENLPKEDLKIAEHRVMDMNTSTSKTSVEDGQLFKRETDAVEVDEMPHQTPLDEMNTEDDSTVAIHSLPEVTMEDKKFGEVSTDSDQLASAQSVSGLPSFDYYLYLVFESYMFIFSISLSAVHVVRIVSIPSITSK
jgi:ribonuclease P/MRP protein subunit RPP1